MKKIVIKVIVWCVIGMVSVSPLVNVNVNVYSEMSLTVSSIESSVLKKPLSGT